MFGIGNQVLENSTTTAENEYQLVYTTLQLYCDPGLFAPVDLTVRYI